MSAHTPGPWRYLPENGSPTTGQHMIAGGKPGYLAEVRDCGSGDIKANARLIAAAPDLLEALLDALPYVEDVLDNPEQLACFKPGTVQRHVKAIRAAIAKATGEAT